MGVCNTRKGTMEEKSHVICLVPLQVELFRYEQNCC